MNFAMKFLKRVLYQGFFLFVFCTVNEEISLVLDGKHFLFSCLCTYAKGNICCFEGGKKRIFMSVTAVEHYFVSHLETL